MRATDPEIESKLNQLALDYQKLYSDQLGLIFSTSKAQEWLVQYLRGKLAADRRPRPYIDEVSHLIGLLERGLLIRTRDIAHHLVECRLRWEEYNEILETVSSIPELDSVDIRVLGLQREKISTKLIELSLPSIQKISSYYGRRHGESPDYYWGAATIGLLKGINRWNPEKQGFSGYIFTWMLNEISETYSHRGLITLPSRMVQEIGKIDKISHELWCKFERPPTPEEIAKEMDCPVSYVEKLQKDHMSIIYLDAPVDGDSEGNETTAQNSLPMSYCDDKGGAVHRMDSSEIMKILQTSINKVLDRGDGLFSMRLHPEAFIHVEGPHRTLGNALDRLRQVGLINLKEELRREAKLSKRPKATRKA